MAYGGVILACWTVLVLAGSGWHWQQWRMLVSSLSAAAPVWPSLHGLAGAAGRHALAAGFLAVFVAVTFRSGGRVLRFVSRGRMEAAEGLCLSVGFGWMALGLAFLGLGLAGLFLPPVLVATALLLGLAGLSGRLPFLRFPADTAGFIRAFLVTGAPALVLSPACLLPPVWVDAYHYHLGAPDQFLKLHRIVTEGMNIAFYFQLTAELLNSFAVILRQDGVTTLVSLVPCLAGIGLAAAWLSRLCGVRAAGLAAGMALSLGVLGRVVLFGKNDPAAAGFGLMALVCTVSSRHSLAAASWGFMCATKLNGYMLAAPAWVWHEAVRVRALGRRWRPHVGWLLLAVAAPAAWQIKNWVLKGDPLWPMLGRFIPGSAWAVESSSALEMSGAGRADFLGYGWDIWRNWITQQPVLLLTLPCALAAAPLLPLPVRALGMTGSVLYVLLTASVRMNYDRYPLPLLLALCFVAAPAVLEIARGRSARFRGAFLAVLVIVSWASLAGTLMITSTRPGGAWRFLLGADSQDAYVAERLTTLVETREILRKKESVRGLLMVEEVRGYRWPGRVWQEEFHGRTPSWALTRETADAGRLSIRLRQRNISHMVFNFVTEGFPQKFAEPYAWDGRQLRLWREFVRGHTEIAIPPEHVDMVNGGFYVYRIVRKVVRPPALVFFLPGIKTLRMYIRQPYTARKDPAETALRAMEYVRQYPDVGVFQFEAAIFSTGAKDWKNAYRLFLPGIRAGMVFEGSYNAFGLAAAMTDRYDEAFSAFGRARELYTDQAGPIAKATSCAHARLAIQLAGGRSGGLASAMKNAREALELSPREPVALYSLAYVYRRMKRYGEALPVLYDLLVIVSNNAVMRGQVLGEIELCETALKAGRSR